MSKKRRSVRHYHVVDHLSPKVSDIPSPGERLNITWGYMKPDANDTRALGLSVILESIGIFLGYPVIGTILGQLANTFIRNFIR